MNFRRADQLQRARSPFRKHSFLTYEGWWRALRSPGMTTVERDQQFNNLGDRLGRRSRTSDSGRGARRLQVVRISAGGSHDVRQRASGSVASPPCSTSATARTSMTAASTIPTGSSGRGDPLTPQSCRRVRCRRVSSRPSLFDVTQGSPVRCSGEPSLTALGIEFNEYHAHQPGLPLRRTRPLRTPSTLAEDTRGKEYFFPGSRPQ